MRNRSQSLKRLPNGGGNVILALALLMARLLKVKSRVVLPAKMS